MGKLPSLQAERETNKHQALAVDWGLRQSTPLPGLVFFKRERPVRPLINGETRFYIDSVDLPDDVLEKSFGHRRRSCLEYVDGSTALEVHWTNRGSSIHTILDLGASSWPVQATLYSSDHGQLGGTYDCDPPHRHHRHQCNAITRSTLGNMQTEVHLVLCIASAPLGRSGFHSSTKGCRDELRKNFSPDTYEGFQNIIPVFRTLLIKESTTQITEAPIMHVEFGIGHWTAPSFQRGSTRRKKGGGSKLLIVHLPIARIGLNWLSSAITCHLFKVGKLSTITKAAPTVKALE